MTGWNVCNRSFSTPGACLSTQLSGCWGDDDHPLIPAKLEIWPALPCPASSCLLHFQIRSEFIYLIRSARLTIFYSKKLQEILLKFKWHRCLLLIIVYFGREGRWWHLLSGRETNDFRKIFWFIVVKRSGSRLHPSIRLPAAVDALSGIDWMKNGFL